jgi:hypothetical protein
LAPIALTLLVIAGRRLQFETADRRRARADAVGEKARLNLPTVDRP